jgi:threonine dehydratase
MLTKDDFLAARERIRDHIVLTPLQGASSLSQMLGMDVFIKNETFQKTGAFKYRGVMNTLLSTTKEELVAGVITASSGNHGKALATAASEREIAATVVLPSTAPLIKIQALQHVHARIFFSEPQRRLQLAEKIAKEEGLLFIHPFNDLRVIAGQSTIGLEILEQYPEVERIVVPMGGGGLITGIASAVKTFRPEVEMVGAETLNVPKFTFNLHRDVLTPAPEKPSVADAIVSNMPGTHTIEGVRRYVDRIVDVTEENILLALKILVESEQVLCEPSSAVVLGAMLQEEFSPKKTVLVISGGNIDPDNLLGLIRRTSL